MRLLITGGAGFMGSNFIKHILNAYPDWSIVNLDKLTYAGNLANLESIADHPNYTFVKGDIAVAADVKKAIAGGVDAIVNYAAETHVDRSIMDPEAFIRTDIFGTYTLLEAARAFGVKKYLQISTDEVFGSIASGSFHEDSPFAPNSPYSAAKAGGDHLCRAYHVTYGVPTIVTHSCNFYGPNQYPEKLIPLFITNLIEGKKVPLYGEGQQRREWIHTVDHCRAIEAVLLRGEPGEVYNIGTGDEFSNLEITQMLLSEFGEGESMIERVKDRPGHDRRYSIDSSKLRTKLDWRPTMKFADGLRATIAWYRDNPSWWRAIKSGDYLKYYQKQYER